MSSFLLNLPEKINQSDSYMMSGGIPVDLTHQDNNPTQTSEQVKAGSLEDWVKDVATGQGTITQLPAGDPKAKIKESSGQSLAAATSEVWLDPKALAAAIRQRSAEQAAENPTTVAGEEELFAPLPSDPEVNMTLKTALDQVTEEMKAVHGLAQQTSSSTVALAKRHRGYRGIGHRSDLVDRPLSPLLKSRDPADLKPDNATGLEDDQDPLTDPDENYQSSEVGSLRKDFTDFKSATESYLERMDKTLKSIDARLKSIESHPAPMMEHGQLISHRRVLSAGLTSPPVAVYTPITETTQQKNLSVDVGFVTRTRYPSSPVVQHSVLSKHLGKDIANSIKLPITRELWNVSGLESLLM